MNKVNFLKGLTKILDKFDERSLIKKIVPMMCRHMQHEKLCLLILPSLINLVRKDGLVSKEEFKEYFWTPIASLC